MLQTDDEQAATEIVRESEIETFTATVEVPDRVQEDAERRYESLRELVGDRAGYQSAEEMIRDQHIEEIQFEL
jgi:hypothetical protein